MNAPARLSAFDLRRVAVAAEVDPRTVARVVAGESVQRANRAAVLAALARLELAPPAVDPTAAK